MKCSYCNNEVPNGATKCPSCGASIDSTVATSTSGSPQAQTSDINATMQTMLQQQMMQQQVMMNQQMQKQMEEMRKSNKSRTIYMLSCILLPGSGIGNFYIGRVGVGLIQLILTITTIGWCISGPWNFIEAFVIKKDSKGKDLS